MSQRLGIITIGFSLHFYWLVELKAIAEITFFELYKNSK